VVENLRGKFTRIPSDRFASYSQTAFERYYPVQFQDEAAVALAIESKADKRAAKRALCLKVLEWAAANPSAAKDSFTQSAAEVIRDLQMIETVLSSGNTG
jgi:hypothetical protein